MKTVLKTVLKKSWTGWRAELGALVLISVTPLLVLAILVRLGGVRVGHQEWQMLACLGAGLTGCGVLLFALAGTIRWLSCWRNARRALLALACFSTCVVVFYSEEDWRGWRAWNRHLQQHQARGEKLELAALIPPPVPDDKNLCECPFLKPLMSLTRTNGETVWRNTNGLARVQALHPWLASSGAHSLITNGLVGWQTYYRSLTNLASLSLTNSPAEDVLLVLRRFEPALAELKHEADLRPAARWNINYDLDSPWGILLPHLATVKGICSLLQLRATALFATGDISAALADLQLGFRFADSIRTEPFLISSAVRVSCWGLLTEPLKEALRAHTLSDGQLADLQRALRSADLLAGHQLALRGERSFGGAWMKLGSRECHELARALGEDFARPFHFLARFSRVAPRGWMYQNEIVLCRIYDEFTLPAVDTATRTVFPERTRAQALAIEQLKGPFAIVASTTFRMQANFGNTSSPKQLAYTQTQVDEALVACALERFRLALGEYPETLDAVTPRFVENLPHDIVGGRPLHYRRTPDGRFLLYSIGWNETDDGGRAALWSADQVDVQAGDWVW